jgi:hypothetical protein
MSTIQSSLPNASSPAYQQMGRSLLALSGQTQAATPAEVGAAPDGLDGGNSTQDPTTLAGALLQVSQQNSLSFLADSAAALQANQSASALIASQPGAAYAAQANLASSGALGLLQD